MVAPQATKSNTWPANPEALNDSPGTPNPPYMARAYLLVAALTLFLSLSEILDYYELPFESQAAHLFASGSLISAGFVTSSMATFGYGGVFILMLLESASLPIPSEVVLPFAGYLVFTGSMNFPAVVLVSTVAGLLGALADYYVALRLGRPIVERLFKWSGAKPDHLVRAERWLDAKGSLTVLVARFIPGMRSAISLPAGALGMKLRTFAAMTAVGSLGWSTLLIYLGYSAGSLWQTVLGRSSPLLTEAVLFAAAIASASYVVYFLSERWRQRKARSLFEEQLG
jgi:membrane protein DedA with SNARE-associated domain